MTLIHSLADLPARGRLMAIDHGTKRIGLAVTDAERRLAQPLETIRNLALKTNYERIHTLVQSYHVAALIVGYPLEMDGREGPRCQSVRAFVRNIEGAVMVPIMLWDERLSTAAAEDFLRDANLTAAQRMEKIDAAAAAVILQSLLDHLSA